MKILHLITSLKVGGAESALVNYLSKIVGRDGNTHSVACFHRGPNTKKIEDLGVKAYQISGMLSIYDPIFFFRLIKLIKFIKPDVIHSSLWSANIIARLIYKFSKIPVICDLHGNSFHEGRFRNWLDRRTVGYCSKIIAVSDSVKDAYLKNIIEQSNRAVASKLMVIKNGIDVESLRANALDSPVTKEEFGLDNCFVVGAVGRLEPLKSYDVLIKAFAKFLGSGAKAKLCIVGDGSQKPALHDLVRVLKIEQSVIFVGYRSDAYKFYPIFDCFALSSRSEGLSIALLEAMAFGLPVITTHLGLDHDVIKHGVNGFLVAPGDTYSYALAINTLYKSPERTRLMGARNSDLVSSNFSIESVIAEYQKAYLKILSKNL
jgi:glycosyltransferase involved in cell wall biosynthesis